MRKSLVILTLLSFLGSASFAEIETMEITAKYRSREGKLALITYRGKDLKIPTDRIQNFSDAIPGKDVTVTLYPKDIGLNVQ